MARRAPALDRERRTMREEERSPSPPSSLDLDRRRSAARTGVHELNEKLHKHTSTGPALTAGDVDADWEDAESVGDEAPGGDNPTPDQDVVEEIGKALGVTTTTTRSCRVVTRSPNATASLGAGSRLAEDSTNEE